MSAMRMALLGVRRAWDDVATRYRLRRMPAVPTVLLVLAAGLVIPHLGQLGQRPTELSLTLAQERIERYVARHPEADADLGPAGTILGSRPAFYWPSMHGADRYVFRLARDDGTAWVSDKVVRTPYHRLRPPGQLAAGAYRFELRALDKEGAELGRSGGSFTVAEPTAELKDLRRLVRYELEPAEGALVLMGYFAEKNSHHDVDSAVLAYAEAAAKDAGAPRLEGKARTWLDRRIRALTQTPAD